MNRNKKELALRSENPTEVLELADTDLVKVQGGWGDDRGGRRNHHDCDDSDTTVRIS